eukprot:TRINITY_DN929_c0_g1_i4.p1 TRINITY_DN929_c0_g1~~TRINITY_DN929_c0_g1_i4.p1  ORF type:complete len:388 (+),score=122.12 TRINITY_DN929_c0_g1_i4:353-1516(+)
MEEPLIPESDPEFLDFEPAPIAEMYDDLMQGPPQTAPVHTMPTDSQLIKEGKGNEVNEKNFTYNDAICNPLKSSQVSCGSFQASKLSTDCLTERMYSVQNHALGRSLPSSMVEEHKSACLIKKEEEPPTPTKFSLQSCELDDKTLDKKSKQERNRVSAQKCRQKKKEYVFKMESELKTIKEELAICKYELELLRGNLLSRIEQQYVNLNEGLLAQAKRIIDSGTMTPKIDEFVTHIAAANKELIMKRCESMNALCQLFLDRIIPDMYTRLLWDAEKSLGVFSSQYLPPEKLGSLRAPEYKENIEYIQNGLRIYRQSIGRKMREFARTKDELLDEIIKLNKYIEMVVLARLPAVNVLSALLLMKAEKLEVSVGEIFELNIPLICCFYY